MFEFCNERKIEEDKLKKLLKITKTVKPGNSHLLLRKMVHRLKD